MIEVKNVSRQYQERVVLKDINVKFEKGLNVIIGRSGSGKTTLLNLMGTLDIPTSGEIYIDGILINDLKEKEINQIRNQKIGFVFQSFFLEPRYTVYENVALPLALSKLKKEEVKKRVYEALEKVGMTDFQNKIATTLSGGETQRVAISRAIVNNPSILFADEPCGNLDVKNGEIVMELLRKLADEGKCVILVTHNQEHLKYADRVIEITDGEIINDYLQNIN